MSDQDITPKILNSYKKSLDIINVQKNNLTTDKNRPHYIDDNTSSNTHKLSDKNSANNKTENSLE